MIKFLDSLLLDETHNSLIYINVCQVIFQNKQTIRQAKKKKKERKEKKKKKKERKTRRYVSIKKDITQTVCHLSNANSTHEILNFCNLSCPSNIDVKNTTCKLLNCSQLNKTNTHKKLKKR